MPCGPSKATSALERDAGEQRGVGLAVAFGLMVEELKGGEPRASVEVGRAGIHSQASLPGRQARREQKQEPVGARKRVRG